MDIRDLHIIDVDSHLTEPHDLWTKNAPAAYVDRVPRVVDVDGIPMWAIDGVTLSRATASGVIRPDGEKSAGVEFLQWAIEDVHPGAYDMAARLDVMDDLGIYAQILYPNVAGFGAQKFGMGGGYAALASVGPWPVTSSRSCSARRSSSISTSRPTA